DRRRRHDRGHGREGRRSGGRDHAAPAPGRTADGGEVTGVWDRWAHWLGGEGPSVLPHPSYGPISPALSLLHPPRDLPHRIARRADRLIDIPLGMGAGQEPRLEL